MKSNKLALVLTTAAALVALSACGNNKKFEPSKDVVEAVKAAEGMTRDELFKKAAEELGEKGQLKVKAITSRGGKDAVKNAFIAELQKTNAKITDPLSYDTVVDGVVYTQLNAEIESGVKDGFSCAILQDGYQLQTKGLDKGYYVNYVPKEWKEATGVNITADSNPMTLQYNFKTWMYNDKNGGTLDNVWDITHSNMVKKVDTMDPHNENVNMDWLIQLTDDTQCDLLKAAFEDPSATTDVKIEDYAKYGEKKKYAYAFIDRYLTNANFYKDDGDAMNNLAKTPGNAGWIVYSKLLKVKEAEDGSVSKKNIVVGALGQDNTDGATKGNSSMKGFGGFMYKHYLQVMPYAQYPYAACAFLNLISTNADAYSVWAADVGDYPSMPSINMDRTKGGNVDGKTEFPCLNDPTSDWWLNKGGAIVETPSFIGANYDNVITFIDEVIAKRAA